MKFAVILISVLSLSSACKAGDFFNGLVSGLEANPSSVGLCGAEMLTVAKGIVSVIQDFTNTLDKQPGAFTKFLQDSTALDELLLNFSTDCSSLNKFFTSLSQFASTTGRKAIMTAYLNNVAVVDNNMYNVWNCEKDYEVCGQSLGTVLRTLTGANLNARLRETVTITVKDLINLANGLFSTYSSIFASTPLCQGDILRLLPSIKEIEDDMSNKGPEVINVWYLSVEYTVLTTCWETDWKNTFSVSAFGRFFNVMELKAWQLSYFMNTESMNKLFSQIEGCSKNYYNCGSAFVSIANLIHPWINYA